MSLTWEVTTSFFSW